MLAERYLLAEVLRSRYAKGKEEGREKGREEGREGRGTDTSGRPGTSGGKMP